MSEKLLPCPFCGGEPEDKRDVPAHYHTVYCAACRIGLRSEEEWNRRTPGPATARIAEILRVYRRAPEFRRVVSVTLTLTREEAAAFLAEHEPAQSA